MVDIKLDRGWYTWTNNRTSDRLVKERIDRFFASKGWLEVSFLSNEVVQQAFSDHDAVPLDILGHKLRGEIKDPRLSF